MPVSSSTKANEPCQAGLTTLLLAKFPLTDPLTTFSNISLRQGGILSSYQIMFQLPNEKT